MAKLTAVEKRYAALREICHSPAFMTDYMGRPNTKPNINSVNLPVLIAQIEALAPLGRTERWKSQVAGWVELLTAEPHSDWIEYLNWAFLQGSVWVSYACE